VSICRPTDAAEPLCLSWVKGNVCKRHGPESPDAMIWSTIVAKDSISKFHVFSLPHFLKTDFQR
jgi:hypothetical protein